MGKLEENGRTCSSTDLDYASMVGRGFGTFPQVVVKLRELQMDDGFLWVRAYESAPEALDGFLQPGQCSDIVTTRPNEVRNKGSPSAQQRT